MKKIFYISLLATFLTGCATVDWNDPKIISEKTQKTNDEYMKVSTIEGPFLRDKANEKGGYDFRWYQLKKFESTIQKGVKEFQIRVIHNYTGSSNKHYVSAHDINGAEFKISLNDRKVESCQGGFIGCTYRDTLGLDVTESYLKKNIGNGIKFKIHGQYGDAEYFIPPSYIQGFLSRAQAN